MNKTTFAVFSLIATFAVIGTAHAQVSTLRIVSPGQYAGAGIDATVEMTGTDLVFDCAAGHIKGPILLDAGNHFDESGTIQAVGGAQSGERTPPMACRFVGELRGKTLYVSVKFESSETTSPPVAATRDAQAVVYLCN